MGNTCLDRDHRAAPGWGNLILDRRTLARATAAFAAMAAAASRPRPKPATAQGTATIAGEWVQPENIGGEGQMQFQADFPFYAIAPHWPGETDFAAAVEIQLSDDGETWSDPAILGPAHTDAGPPDREDRTFGQLAFNERSQFVRYRPLDADGSTRAIPGLAFTYIDATGGPGLGDITTDSPVPSLNRPPIISREEWGASLAYGGVEAGARDWVPEYQTVQHVIIHHSETPNLRDPLTEIRSIHYYHAITRDWGDIGYNYLVDFMGNVYEGRTGGDNVVGGHAYQYAYGSSGICEMGSFTHGAPTPEALAGLIWITAWCVRDLDPLGRSDFHEQPNLPTICGHRDVNDSTCPGDGLYADLGYIREAVAEVLAGARETIPNPEYSPGQIVETTTDDANLRRQPGLAGGALPVPAGSVFRVVEGPTTIDDYIWYRIDGSSGTGWMATVNFGPSDAAPPAGRFVVGEQLVVSTDKLNIRENPSLRGPITATLSYMDAATVTDGPMPANGYSWYRIDTGQGAGWSAEQYLSHADALNPVARFRVGESVQVDDPEGLKLRSAPSITASKVASMSPGVSGTVVDGPKAADGYIWMQIRTSAGTGWCVEDFLTYGPDSAPDPAKFVEGDRVVVDTDALNLREKPGATGPILVSLGTGVGGTIIAGPEFANNMAWYKLETEYGTGWSAGSFLALASEASSERQFDPGQRVYVSTDALNLRTAPGTGSGVVAVLPTYTTASVVDGPVEKDGYIWYQIDSDQGTGWSAAQFLAKGTPDPATSGFGINDTVYVNTDALNLRASASLSGGVVTTLATDQDATIIGAAVDADGFTWVKVRAGSQEGWCVTAYLAKAKGASPRPGGRARVIDGELNLRAAGSTGSDIIAVLPDATFVDVLEGPIGGDAYDWFRVSTSRFGTGWCAGQYLEVV